jgi:hypothetical protein
MNHAPEVRPVAALQLQRRPSEWAALVLCATLDVMAARILLAGAPPAWPEVVIAASAHGLAVLLVARLMRSRSCRHWLGVASLLAVPVAGVPIAAAVLATRGHGSLVLERRRRGRGRSDCTSATVRRLAAGLSTFDALHCDDEEQRRTALLTLASQGDPESIVLLRRAAAARDADLALFAALTLDELRERTERGAGAVEPVEARYDVG